MYIALMIILAVLIIFSLIYAAIEHESGGLIAFGICCILFWATNFISLQVIGYDTETILEEDLSVVALQDGHAESGEYFLGSGTTDGEPTYIFAYEADGGYLLKQVNAEEVVLRYIDDGSEPRYKKYVDHIVGSKFAKFYFSGLAGDTKRYVYVPEGTVKQSFNVDLK